MGNDKGHEASERGHGATKTEFIKALEDHAQNHRAPADENGGGVQVGDRGPPFQIHAENQGEGVHDPSQENEIKGRPAKRLRKLRHGRKCQQ